ncbi:MAG: hypothetical protein R2880_18630, partial [Deinococcales bacterium]
MSSKTDSEPKKRGRKPKSETIKQEEPKEEAKPRRRSSKSEDIHPDDADTLEVNTQGDLFEHPTMEATAQPKIDNRSNERSNERFNEASQDHEPKKTEVKQPMSQDVIEDISAIDEADEDEEDPVAKKSSRSSRDDNDKSSSYKGSSSSKKRRRIRGPRRPSLSFKELQEKILPELHLLAKEVGLDDFRELSKEKLTIAILERNAEAEGLNVVKGYLEISTDGYGFLQESLLQDETRSVIVSAGLIKQFKLRTGDYILGKSRYPRENERYGTLIRVEAVNGVDPQKASKRPRFDDLVPTFPEARIRLETTQQELSTRVIDLLAPIGRGQRGLIVAPPKAGKTTLLKKVANAVITNEPDIKVIVLLIDERPEEVTDFRESVSGVEVVASTFDEPPTNHIRVAEFVHERSRRIV